MAAQLVCWQPLTGLPVGLPPLPWGRWPDQGIGQATGMENGLAAAGAANQVDLTALGEVIPVGGPAALMAAQRQPGTVPAVEAQQRCFARLVQQESVERHLCVPIAGEGGQ